VLSVDPKKLAKIVTLKLLPMLDVQPN